MSVTGDLNSLYQFFLSCPLDSVVPNRRVSASPHPMISNHTGYLYGLSHPASTYPNRFCGIQWRDFDTKEKSIYLPVMGLTPLFYNLGDSFSDFTFGKTVILVEGPKDAEAVKTVHPYVLGILGSLPSRSQFHFLKMLSKKFVVLFDDDKTGREQSAAMCKMLKYSGCTAIPTFIDGGDPGDYFVKEKCAIVNKHLNNLEFVL